MKTRSIFVFLLGVVISKTLEAAVLTPVHITIQEPTSTADIEIPGCPDDMIRIKRSGSGSGSPDFFGYIKRGITNKISQFAQASAGASAHFSKTSSGGGGGGGGGYYYPDPHDPPLSYGTKSFDFWTLKKSILNTLLQAVKAINGGIIAIKGQLIKGSGAIVSAKGRLISMKGEAISNLGKHLINNAKLSPTSYHSKPIPEYTAPTGHSGPSALPHPSPSYGPPPSQYGPPSSPSSPSASAPTAGFPDHPPSTYGAPTAPAYGPPIGPSGSALPSQAYLPQKLSSTSYDEYNNKLKPSGHAGIIILKKIPKDVEVQHTNIATLPLQDERNKVLKTTSIPKTPPFSPLPPTAPPKPPSAPHKEIANSFFESSLKPISPFEAIYGSPIETPPTSNDNKALSALVAPSAPNFFKTPGPISAPTAYVDDSFLSEVQKPSLEGSKGQNLLNLPKVPEPFEINSFTADVPLSNFGLGALNHIQPTHSSPFPAKTDFVGGLEAPPFNLGPHNSYPVSSHLQYNNGFLEHKEGSPNFDVVKSIEYEIHAQKRH